MDELNQTDSSYYHPVNPNFVINLAEIGFAEDRTTYCQANAGNQYIAPLLESGRTCRVGLRHHSDRSGSSGGGQSLDITRQEFDVLMDALAWYNRHFAQPKE